MDLTSNNYTDKLDISVSGTTPTGGYLNYENSILKDGCLTMDEYKVTIENGEVTTTEKGSCENQSLTACDSPNFKPSPEEWFAFDASTNTITGFSDAWDGTTDITIPCKIDGVDVVHLSNSSFSSKGLTSVIFNDNIKNTGYSTFTYNKITKLILGENLEIINAGAFGNNNISEVIIPNGVTLIDSGSFSYNKITKLVLGENLETIVSGGAFAGNQLTEVIIPNKVSSIGVATFQKNESNNPNLSTIYNNTGKEFDWGSIINGPSGYNFETGIVENDAGNVEIKKSN